jgi:hypothetical protein
MWLLVLFASLVAPEPVPGDNWTSGDRVVIVRRVEGVRVQVQSPDLYSQPRWINKRRFKKQFQRTATGPADLKDFYFRREFK